MSTRLAALIVDDQDDIRMLLRRVIELAEGPFEVAGEAADGYEALNVIGELDPALVVLDHMMPGMTGLELARAILLQRPSQAIVLCSAFLNDELRAQAEALGIIACLPKSRITEIPNVLHQIVGNDGANGVA